MQAYIDTVVHEVFGDGVDQQLAEAELNDWLRRVPAESPYVRHGKVWPQWYVVEQKPLPKITPPKRRPK